MLLSLDHPKTTKYLQSKQHSYQTLDGAAIRPTEITKPLPETLYTYKDLMMKRLSKCTMIGKKGIKKRELLWTTYRPMCSFDRDQSMKVYRRLIPMKEI